MARGISRDRVIVAQLTGTVARYGQGRRYSHDEALAEIARILAAVKARGDRSKLLLTMAAAMFVKPNGPGDGAWYPDALALLIEAGADPARAAELRQQQVRSANLVT